jgi:anthranilate synthase/aminodeoxychorismate synthase-like glutamine amidotransferase
MIFIVDNYDSFTYNLVQYLGELGQQILVYRNDRITVERIMEMSPGKIVISPGPGKPENAGISKDVIRVFSGKVPVLGVCLGHQSIAEVYGAEIVKGCRIMHGKVSEIHHDGKGIFNGIPSPFVATRYHSLVIKPDTLKEPLYKTAWTSDGEIMGVAHRDFPLWGVQFHPESILTVEGKKLLKNFVDM